MGREEPQISFRLKDERQKKDFEAALDKQEHVSSQKAFFVSVIKALKDASDEGILIEWPVELVTKSKKKK